MNRWAIIDKDNKVVNVVLWDGPKTEWCPPRGHMIVQCDRLNGIGDIYNPIQNSFIKGPKIESKKVEDLQEI